MCEIEKLGFYVTYQMTTLQKIQGTFWLAHYLLVFSEIWGRIYDPGELFIRKSQEFAGSKKFRNWTANTELLTASGTEK